MDEPKMERRILGVVEVDSGTLVIGDPAYVLPSTQDDRPGTDYSAVLQDLSGDRHQGTQLDGKPVVLLANFGGDGAYGVIGELEDGELMRAIIEFQPLELDDA